MHSFVGPKTDFYRSRILWVLMIIYIHVCLEIEEEGPQTGSVLHISKRLICDHNRQLQSHSRDNYSAPSRVLDNTLVINSGLENKSWMPLLISLEGMDSSTPSLSSQRETPHARWQREQMFSHKAQMGKADKHQQSAEKERWGECEESTQQREPPASSALACSLTSPF